MAPHLPGRRRPAKVVENVRVLGDLQNLARAAFAGAHGRLMDAAGRIDDEQMKIESLNSKKAKDAIHTLQ